MRKRVLADDRWHSAHGISRCSEEFLSRLTARFDVARLTQLCPIRDPLAPWKLASAIRKNACDVFWSPGFVPPASSPVPFVFTLHDLNYIHVGSRLQAAYFNLVIRPLCRRAAKIATVSEFSKSEICSWAGIAADRVAVIPNGVSKTFSPRGPRHDPGYPYFFYAGNHLPHKNIPRMLTAFAAAAPGTDLRLILTGDPEPELMRLARRLGIAERLSFTCAITETQLQAHYRGAEAVMFLSTHEGFGLPVLEAMASGTPVLAARAASIPEVAGDAALLVDPLNVDEISEGMRRILYDTDLRAECRAKGFERSAQFDWDRSAILLSNVLTEAAAERAA